MHRRSSASKGRFGVAEPEGCASICERQSSQRNCLGASAFFIRAYFETTETTCKNNFFFSPCNYTAFLNRRAVARRKGKLFQTSCFPSLEDVVVNYTDAPTIEGCGDFAIALSVGLWYNVVKKMKKEFAWQ